MSVQERTNSQAQSEPQGLESNLAASLGPTPLATKISKDSNAGASSTSNMATPNDSGPSKLNVRLREDTTDDQVGLDRPHKRARTVDLQTGDNAASQPQIDVTMASPETSPSNERKTSSPALSLTAEHQALAERVLDMVLVMQNARPFLKPVDPEAARAPDYHKVIKRPIDLGTIKKRLRTRLLGISPPTPYASLQEFVDDVELVFDNCFRYNGVKHGISLLAIRVKDQFDREMQAHPAGKELKFWPIPEVIPATGPQVQSSEPKDVLKTSSNGTSTTQATDNAALLLAKKRTNQVKKQLTPILVDHRSRRDPLRIAQLKFCKTVLDQLYHKAYRQIVTPFLRPVDLDLYPDYLQIISQPMDLLAIQDKYSHGAYASPEDFHNDLKLIFENCYKYNPQGTPVWQYGKRVEKIVEDKWKELPTTIPEESQKQKRLSGGSSTTSKAKLAQSSKPETQKKVYAPLSEDQKLALCDFLVSLSESKMKAVIRLLRKRMPQFRENEEEVELEFQNIPATVQAEMYEFLKQSQEDRMEESTDSDLSSIDSESSFSSS